MNSVTNHHEPFWPHTYLIMNYRIMCHLLVKNCINVAWLTCRDTSLFKDNLVCVDMTRKYPHIRPRWFTWNGHLIWSGMYFVFTLKTLDPPWRLTASQLPQATLLLLSDVREKPCCEQQEQQHAKRRFADCSGTKRGREPGKGDIAPVKWGV